MIDVAIAISVLDHLRDFLKGGREDKERQFQNVIEPLYRDGEAIVRDYTGLFTELIAKLESDEDILSVRKWLDSRVYELRPLRDKVRALLPTLNAEYDYMNQFQRGIWGILRGSVSLVETGHVQMRTYGCGSHTVLDVLQRWPKTGGIEARERVTRIAYRQRDALRAAWRDAVQGYAQLKKAAFSSSGR
jgi:hypothetical protein